MKCSSIVDFIDLLMAGFFFLSICHPIHSRLYQSQVGLWLNKLLKLSPADNFVCNHKTETEEREAEKKVNLIIHKCCLSTGAKSILKCFSTHFFLRLPFSHISHGKREGMLLKKLRLEYKCFTCCQCFGLFVSIGE